MCLGPFCFDLINSVTSKENTQVATEAASKCVLNRGFMEEHGSKITAVRFLLLLLEWSFGNIC